MNRLYCEMMIDLAEWLYGEACDGHVVAGVFDYYDSCDLLSCLIECGDYQMLSIDIHHPEFDDYDDMYLITVADEGSSLHVERAKINDKYLDFEADVMVVAPYVGSQIVNSNLNTHGFNLELVLDGDEEFCESDCDYCVDPVGCLEELEDDDIDDEDDCMVDVSFDIDGEERSFKLSSSDAMELMQALFQI